MRRRTGAAFELLSDAECRLIDLFDVRHEAGRLDGRTLAQSANFLLDPAGSILACNVTSNYRKRMKPAAILRQADRLLRYAGA